MQLEKGKKKKVKFHCDQTLFRFGIILCLIFFFQLRLVIHLIFVFWVKISYLIISS